MHFVKLEICAETEIGSVRLRVRLRVRDSVDVDWRIVQNRMSLAASLKMALRNHCSKNQRGVNLKFRAFFVSLQLHT